MIYLSCKKSECLVCTSFSIISNLIASFKDETWQPYKHTTYIPLWNDVETVASTSFQRGTHVVRL